MWSRWKWNSPTGRRATKYSSARAIHWWVCSVVWPFTLCAGSQSTLLLALPSAPPQLWECQQLALVSLRHCFHKATSADPLKSGPRTTVVMHLDLLWELWRQLRSWPGPHMHTPTKPPAAKTNLSQLQEHPLAVRAGAVFTKLAVEV